MSAWKKACLVTALVGSLGLNLGLALRAPAVRPAPVPVASVPTPPPESWEDVLRRSHSVAADTAYDLPPFTNDFATVAEQLKHSGLPRHIVIAILQSLFALRDEAELRAAAAGNRTRKWNPNPTGSNSAKSVVAGIRSRHLREIEGLLGDAYMKALAGETNIPPVPDRFGDLPAAKRAVVLQLESDYKESINAFKKSNPGDFGASMTPMVEARMAEELRATLTEEELHDYLRYNASTATALQEVLAAVDVNEEEYHRLVDADLTEAQKPKGASATQQRYDRYLDVLGPERFADITPKLEPRAGDYCNALAAIGCSVDARIAVFRALTNIDGFGQRLDHETTLRTYDAIAASLTPAQMEQFAQSKTGRSLLRRLRQ